jgi:hypothetical protein
MLCKLILFGTHDVEKSSQQESSPQDGLACVCAYNLTRSTHRTEKLRSNTDKAKITTKSQLLQLFLLPSFILIAKSPIFISVTGLKLCCERTYTKVSYQWWANLVYKNRQNVLCLWKTNTVNWVKWKHFSWMHFSKSTEFQINRLLLVLKLRT